MEKYSNVNGNSGVSSYKIESDSITVKFKEGDTYLYTYQVTGKVHVEKMKALAKAGKGLSTYISQNVKKSYASKT